VPGREPELDTPEIDEVDTVYKRRLAISVALIALFGGLVGFAASDAGARQAELGREAQRASVSALAAQNDAANAYYESFGNYVEASTLNRQRDMARVAAELLGDDGAAAQARAWDAAGRQVGDVSTLLGDPRYTGRPDLLFYELHESPNLGMLRQQAAQETASDWGTKSDRYIGLITLLAVALTLLGLSLTVGVGVRALLVWPAGLIVASCVIAGAVVFVRPAATTSDDAIRAVAEGDRLAWGRAYDEAVAAYTRASDLDRDYVVPYQRRATATLLAGSPERNLSSFVFSSSTREARLAAIADLRRAVDMGGDDYVTLANLGANYFHVNDYAASEEFSRRAIAVNPSLPIPWSNLMLAQAAQGREAEALATAQRSLDLIAKRPYRGERRELLASLRATLETLAGKEKRTEALVRRLSGLAVAAQFRMEVPDGREAATARVSDLAVVSAGSTLTASMVVHDMPRDSWIGFVVSYLPDGQDDWAETAAQSSFYRWDFATSALPRPYSIPMYEEGCRTTGQYRLSVYSGGRLLAATTVRQQPSTSRLVGHTDLIGRLQLCRPDGWTLRAETSGSADVTSPDGRQRFSLRSLPLAGPPTTAAARAGLVDQVLDRLRARLAPAATVTGEAQLRIASVPGTARFLRLPGGEEGTVWASLQDDNVLRVALVRYPAGAPGATNEVALSARFLTG
jgi:tetratricopeptide (TPR) repeat protein